MKARKLPSGSWRARVTYTDDEGHRRYKSFTCQDESPRGKRLVENAASEWALERRNEKRTTLTLGQAIDEYIEDGEPVWSPRTTEDYERTRRLYVQGLMDIPIHDITQRQIQKAINKEIEHLSPKTVHNIHGLISAVMGVYRPSFRLQTKLPKVALGDMYVPSDEDVKRLILIARQKDLVVPVLLAVFGTLRRGEICALTSDDVYGNSIHVYKNMVWHSKKRDWIVKIPKNHEGGRNIELPEWVVDTFRHKQGRLVEQTPGALTAAFGRLRKQSDLPSFRFHDLRHYSASIQHALGIPDKYIMDRGGWTTRTTLDKVYKHVMDAEKKKFSDVANDHFSELCATNCATKIQKPL